VKSEEVDGKNVYSITPKGERFLEERRGDVNRVFKEGTQRCGF